MAFLIFKNIVKRLDVNTKKYFVEKMQEYEYLLTEKRTELENIKLVNMKMIYLLLKIL